MIVAKMLLLVVIGCGPKDSDGGAPRSAMRCLDVPQKTPFPCSFLEMRKPSEDSKDLFLRWVPRIVYFYDHDKGTLTLVDRKRWENASGAVTDYKSWLKVPRGPDLGTDDGKLIYWYEKTGNRIIATKGESAMRVSLSLRQNWAASLTRDKNSGKAGEKSERNYVELFTYPGGKPVGSAYELPFTEFKKIQVVCWSSGDTHLVVADNDQDQICIIELPGMKDKKDAKKKDAKKEEEK